MAKKLFIKTFGCQMNEYDSDKIETLLSSKEKVEKISVPDEADIIVFNTCSVREKAQEKVFSDLGRVKKYKLINPDVLIGVGGCVASQEGENIIKRAPYVDIVFGPQTIHRLPEMIKKKQETKLSQVDIQFPEIEKFDHLPVSKKNSCTAFVSIMEGCSKYCSFCVVPYTRGTEFSRPVIDIIKEIHQLAKTGVKEVTLLGQNVNAYFDSQHEIDFSGLLELISDIDLISRIRYTSAHPREVSKNLIKSYKSLPKLVNQLHLPVQSGSDRILSAMKRGYTSLEYKSIIKKIRKHRPNISVSSDFIVGFPGETEDDFKKTIDLVKKIKFDGSFSFAYSDRPGTPASSLINKVDSKTKFARLRILQKILEKQSEEYSNGMLNNEEKILVEGNSKKNPSDLMGRTENNKVVNFKGPKSLIGQFTMVKICEIKKHSLRGKLIC